MQVQDCPWEIENIGKKTVQLNYALKDIYNSEEVNGAIAGYQYVVAKVPCGNISCLLGLQQDGFRVMETQLSLSKKMKDFDFDDRLLRVFKGRLHYEIISNEDGLNRVLSRMTPNMFSTDRIYLDPEFGPEIGLRRYRNWTRTEFQCGASLSELMIDNESLGFCLLKMDGSILDSLLAGVYEEYQGKGFGILTPACSCLFPKMMGYKDIKKCKTAISSNNKPVVALYNYLNFKIDEMKYVLVKSITPPIQTSISFQISESHVYKLIA